MSNQTQCPNCGGYKVNGKLTKIDPNTGKEIKAGLGCAINVIGIVVITPLAALVFVSFGIDPGVSMWLGWFVCIGILGWLNAKENKKKDGSAHNYFGFSCNLCGYQWIWREGTPLPKVKVQPDLIAAGARRWEQQVAQMQCRACGNTILEGQSHCAFCGASR